MKLRLLSWNVHGLPAPFSRDRQARLGRIALRILEERPDVVTLQEVWSGALRVLAGALSDYAPCYKPLPPGGTAGGLLSLVRRGRRLRVVEGSVRFRRYSESAAKHRIWEADGIAGKGALITLLEHPDGERLCVINTHLQSRYRSDAHTAIRGSQVAELSGWTKELPVSSTVIVAGDFNTPAEEAIYEGIAAIGRDVTVQARAAGHAVTNYPVHANAAWIDYVVVRPADGRHVTADLRLIENRGPDDPYSDHHGLVADLSLEG